MTTTNETFIKRCLALAENGLGTTYPNPLVGSVIVHNNKIIGEGWHYQSGQPHAEINAINSVKDKTVLKEATLYVNLEPCSHTGKTPPCADAIIENQIPKVVIGTQDPFAEVNGSGIKKLQDAGIDVTVGILEKECREVNKRFFSFHGKKRPFVLLKWAQSLDGFLSPEMKLEKKPVWISSPVSRQLVHKWRTEEQAILVGTKTAIEDNPKLDARDWKGNNPTRVLIDQHLVVHPESHLLDGSVKTIVITEKKEHKSFENTHFETINFYKNIPEQIGQVLYKHGIQSLLVEGGGKTLQDFIDAKYWDEARVFMGTIEMIKGTHAPTIKANYSKREAIDEDQLVTYYNKRD